MLLGDAANCIGQNLGEVQLPRLVSTTASWEDHCLTYFYFCLAEKLHSVVTTSGAEHSRWVSQGHIGGG